MKDCKTAVSPVTFLGAYLFHAQALKKKFFMSGLMLLLVMWLPLKDGRWKNQRSGIGNRGGATPKTPSMCNLWQKTTCHSIPLCGLQCSWEPEKNGKWQTKLKA